MSAEKSNQFNPKDLFTIPNLITYFRILCIPIFVTLTIISGQRNDVSLIYWALGVFVVAAMSDLLDGYLARRFNWSTGVGMLLDPFADKLMQVSVVLCLAFAVTTSSGEPYLHWAIVVAIVAKEAYMVLCAPIIAKKGVEVKANMIGKVASATLSLGVVFCFFHPFVAPWDWAIISTAVLQSYFAAGFYTVDVLRQLKQMKLEAQAIELADEAIENDKTKSVNEVESLELDKSKTEKIATSKTATAKPATAKTVSNTATVKPATAKTASNTATAKPATVKTGSNTATAKSATAKTKPNSTSNEATTTKDK